MAFEWLEDMLGDYDMIDFGVALLFYALFMLLFWKMGIGTIDDALSKQYTLGKIIASVIGYPLCLMLVHWQRNK